jgi:nucleotide-binding universal stress UspA family protein
MKTINTILVPIDLSDSSALVLESAIKISLQLNSKLMVMHAVPMTAIAMPIEGQAVYNEEMIEEVLDESKKLLKEFLDQNTDSKLDLTQHVVLGEPTIEINLFAEKNACDLIVMGTHGRTGLKHLLMGSVAEHVLRHSTVPVMSIPYRD